MKRFRVRRTVLLALAMAFLVVAWVWDGLIAVGRWIAGFIPWARFKQSFARLVDLGYRAQHEPWDAFWGQRYATVLDPDGNHVDLYAALPTKAAD